MICKRPKSGIFLFALLFVAACGESGMQSFDQGTTVAKPDETSKVFGEHEVHFNAFHSTFLLPEVAKLYGIGRNDHLGVVMVSVIRKDTPGIGVDAHVGGAATNMASQMKMLDFDEIREGDAIYHISTFPFDQQDQLTFTVAVEIAPTGETHNLKWRHQF